MFSQTRVGKDGKLFKIKENIVLSDVGDTDTIIVKKLNKGNAVWVDKEDENNIIENKKNNKNNKIYILAGVISIIVIYFTHKFSRNDKDDFHSFQNHNIAILRFLNVCNSILILLII